jgi:hypothetical protein
MKGGPVEEPEDVTFQVRETTHVENVTDVTFAKVASSKQKSVQCCLHFRRTYGFDYVIDGGIICKHICLIFSMVKVYYLTSVCT